MVLGLISRIKKEIIGISLTLLLSCESNSPIKECKTNEGFTGVSFIYDTRDERNMLENGTFPIIFKVFDLMTNKFIEVQYQNFANDYICSDFYINNQNP